MSKALKAAIEANDPEAARKALKTVKDLGRKLPKAEAPLAYAAEQGADAVMAVLIEAGAAMPEPNFEGLHPFAIAADKGHHKVLQVLAKHQVPEKVIEHALFMAAMSGKAEVVRAILESCKPPIPERVIEVATWWKDGVIFNLLLAHGADVNARNDGTANHEQLGKTPLHEAAGAGYLEPIRLLLSHGAEVNAKDAFGRTPLMRLAARMPGLDQQVRLRKERESRVLTEAQKALQAKIAAQSRNYGDRENCDGMPCAQLLLEHGADAKLADKYGNDALMHYEWERMRDRAEPNEAFIALLRKAGAKGGEATMDLFLAIRSDDLAAARKAIAAGGNVNQDGPLPVSTTPLVMSRSAAMVALLLESGADPNKPSSNTTPLIAAAGSGELEVVKMLIAAGADIHAIEPRSPGSEYIANAFSAADGNRKHDVAEYLKSLGAQKPVLKDWKPLEAEVGMWENFSEIVVKGEVSTIAAAVAKLIGGKIIADVYGQDLLPGKKPYVVLRPKGMRWCNLLQVMPRPTYEVDTKFLKQLAQAAQTPVILAQYSDAAGAADVERFEPDGTSQKDEGWDQSDLEELVGELGDEAPEWMKERLKAMEEAPEEPLDSDQRLDQLAAAEKFAIAWGGLDAEPGRKVEISFTNLPVEAFDGVAWVSAE